MQQLSGATVVTATVRSASGAFKTSDFVLLLNSSTFSAEFCQLALANANCQLPMVHVPNPYAEQLMLKKRS